MNNIKIKFNDEVLFEITETDFLLLQHNYIDVEEEIKRQLQWSIKHLCEIEFKNIKEEGFNLLSKDTSISSIPVNRDDLIKTVTSHHSYRNRIQRRDEKIDGQ